MKSFSGLPLVSAGPSSGVPVSLCGFWSYRYRRPFEGLWVDVMKVSKGLSSYRTYNIVIMLWWFSARVLFVLLSWSVISCFWRRCCVNTGQNDDPSHQVLMIKAVKWNVNLLNRRLVFHFALLLNMSEGQARGVTESSTGCGAEGIDENKG